MAVVLVTLACAVPTFTNPTTPVPTTAIVTAPSEDAKAELLLKRLEEIKDMDKSNLSRAEKKALRKEVKEIKATMKTSSNGVYLSIGDVIIIILLLILILLSKSTSTTFMFLIPLILWIFSGNFSSIWC